MTFSVNIFFHITVANCNFVNEMCNTFVDNKILRQMVFKMSKFSVSLGRKCNFCEKSKIIFDVIACKITFFHISRHFCIVFIKKMFESSSKNNACFAKIPRQLIPLPGYGFSNSQRFCTHEYKLNQP